MDPAYNALKTLNSPDLLHLELRFANAARPKDIDMDDDDDMDDNDRRLAIGLTGITVR